MSTLFGTFPLLNKLFADGGYQGPQFANAVGKILPYLDVEIVKRSDGAVGSSATTDRFERSLSPPKLYFSPRFAMLQQHGHPSCMIIDLQPVADY